MIRREEENWCGLTAKSKNDIEMLEMARWNTETIYIKYIFTKKKKKKNERNDTQDTIRKQKIMLLMMITCETLCVNWLHHYSVDNIFL